MVVYGMASGEAVEVDPQRLVEGNQSMTGFYIGGYFKSRGQQVEAEIAEIIGFVKEGKVKLQVGTTLPLSRAVEAHRLLEGRKTTGKVVLEPWA
jgi:NADPH2:quinone reductase